MPEINTQYKNPILFGKDNGFMTLGLMESQGLKFLVFYDLSTGKVYVEETFTTTTNGEHVLGLNEIKEDSLWIALVQHAKSSGIVSIANIIRCLDYLHIPYNKKQLDNLIKNATTEDEHQQIKNKA
jgi:hypothetical protein